MSELAKIFSLSDLFRNFFSGAFFFVGIAYVRFGFGDSLICHFQSFGWVYIGLSILTGTLIYSLHRSSTLYVIELLRCWLIPRSADIKSGNYPVSKPWERYHRQTIELWEAQRKKPSLCKHLTVWADSIHYLYTTSIALALAWLTFKIGLFGYCYSSDAKTCDLLGGSIFIGLFAAITDVRHHLAENFILDSIQEGDPLRTPSGIRSIEP